MKRFLLFFLIRLLFIFLIANFYHPPDWEYGEIARNIISGNGYSRSLDTGGRLFLTSSHAPLYPYFLAFFYQFGIKPSTFLLIQIFQAIFSTFVVVFIVKTAQIIYDKRVAEIAGWLVGLYPPFINYCIRLGPTTMLLFLLSLTIFLILKSKESGIYSYLLAGASLALTILCDPISFALYPALLLHFLFKNLKLKGFILIVLSSLILLTPWTIRNYLVHKKIIPVTTHFGVNFWIGNNPNATGTDFYRVNPQNTDNYILMTHTLPIQIQDSLKNIEETQRAHFYLSKGLEFIKNYPEDFLKLLLKKFYYYWWFPPREIYFSEEVEKYKTLLIIFYIPVLLFGFSGIIFSGGYFKKILLPFFSIIFISFIYVIAHVGLIRYRMPVELYLILFAAYFLNILIKKLNIHQGFHP